MQFDHAGIATDDLDALAELYGSLLDASVVHEEELNDLRIAFLDLGGAYLELLEPLPDADGPIANYLDAEGPGIHHLAVETDDIEGALDHAREVGVEVIDDEPRQGAWGHEIAFLHPGSTGGVLVEFVEH